MNNNMNQNYNQQSMMQPVQPIMQPQKTNALCIVSLILAFILGPVGTILGIVGLINAKKHGVESGVDKVFDGFVAVQFFVCLALVIIYLLMMKFLGFFVATVVFMIAALLYLGVPKVHMVIAVIAINLLVYFAFIQFLGVKLPAGLLF